MTKDQEYKLLFESWNKFTGRKVLLEIESQESKLKKLSVYLLTFKSNISSSSVIDYLKKNFDIVSEFDNKQLSDLKSFLDKNIKQGQQDIPALSQAISAKIDEIFAKQQATKDPLYTDDQYNKIKNKAKEKFSLDDRDLTAGEMAKVGTGLAGLGLAAGAGKIAFDFLVKPGTFRRIAMGLLRGAKNLTKGLLGFGGGGKKGGAAAAEEVAKKLTPRQIRNIKDAAIGYRFLGFLGGGALTVTAGYLLYKMYDEYFSNNVTEAVQADGISAHHEKIVSEIEKLKADKEFWGGFMSHIGKEIKQSEKTSSVKIPADTGEFVNYYHKIKGKSPEAKEKRKQERETIRAIAAKTQERFPADWKQDTEFLDKVKAWCNKYGVPMQNILALIYHETAFTMSPGKVGSNGCTGLIMFCPNSGMQMIKKDGRQLAAMTRAEQWDYVEFFLDKNSKWKRDPKNIASLYLAVFLPAFAGLPDDAVIASKLGKSDPQLHPRVRKFSDKSIKAWWKQNPANRDRNDRDRITKSGLKPILSRYIPKVSSVVAESKIPDKQNNKEVS